jgi:hypothetical protein
MYFPHSEEDEEGLEEDFSETEGKKKGGTDILPLFSILYAYN